MINEKPVILIVDDDEVILQTAKIMLGSEYNVITADGGEPALRLLTGLRPALILLDVMMPGMDGFETMERIRGMEGVLDIPVMFLTGDENRETEVRCFKCGASDFIRKPFVMEVLQERAKRIIRLDVLQKDLEKEVQRQTARVEHLSDEVMLALSKAVDAKDHYTNGHSQRVADYSVKIARRLGFDETELKRIYTLGLLHDVGKIGVSEAIINKTSRLTPDEYDIIKTHTTMGYEILKLITEIPELATGARWHHERYDGTGYPDGLSGIDIPLEARIICVADSYDAMTSNRSYTSVRPQSKVREELIRCRGTQFDPEIADIMVELMDEDTEYLMSERSDKPKVSISEEQVMGIEPMIKSGEKEFYELMPSRLKKIDCAFKSIEETGDNTEYSADIAFIQEAAMDAELFRLSSLAGRISEGIKSGDTASLKALHRMFMQEWGRTYRSLGEKYKVTDSSHEPLDPALKTVLLIDDDDMMRGTIKSILGKNYNVLSAESAEKALAILEENNPDLVLLDYEMPVCDGPETYRLIRGKEKCRDIPVIFMTGAENADQLGHMKELTGQPHISKIAGAVRIRERVSQILPAT